MDNFIFCKTCHAANDLDSDFCTGCGCDLIDNVYFDSTNNTNLNKHLIVERKTGKNIKVEFKLNNTSETLYTIRTQPSPKFVLLFILVILTAFLIPFILFNGYFKRNELNTTIVTAGIFGLILISFLSISSNTFLVQTPNQAIIGKIILKNLLQENKWKYLDANSTELFQLTFSSKHKGHLLMYDQSYSILTQRHNRDACTVTNGMDQPILKAINESRKVFPRSLYIYYDKKFDELVIIFVIFSIIMKNFTKKSNFNPV